jgi:hypothetical protein
MTSQQYKTISTNKKIEQMEEAIKELMKNAILMNMRLKELEKPWYVKIKDKIINKCQSNKYGKAQTNRKYPETLQETG